LRPWLLLAVLAACHGADIVTILDKPVAVKVDLPDVRRDDLLLLVEGVSAPADQGAWFRVYLGDSPPSQAKTTSKALYLGDVNSLPRSTSSARRESSAVLALPKNVRELAAGKPTLTVTFVPVGSYKKPITVRSVRISSAAEE
jgi:hypothetical protein